MANRSGWSPSNHPRHTFCRSRFPTLDPTTIDGSEAQEVKDTIQHVTNTLLDTHVTLYAVDPKSLAAGMAEITDQTTAEFVGAIGDASPGLSATFNSDEDFDRLA